MYHAYFGMSLGDQDKEWVPHIVCQTCFINLYNWACKKLTPMVWREPSNHHDDCYYCMVKTIGYNQKTNKKYSTLRYPPP